MSRKLSFSRDLTKLSGFKPSLHPQLVGVNTPSEIKYEKDAQNEAIKPNKKIVNKHHIRNSHQIARYQSCNNEAMPGVGLCFSEIHCISREAWDVSRLVAQISASSLLFFFPPCFPLIVRFSTFYLLLPSFKECWVVFYGLPIFRKAWLFSLYSPSTLTQKFQIYTCKKNTDKIQYT